jgi:hypothetical protein
MCCPPERRIQHGAGEWQLMASGEHRMLGHQVPAVADLSALARAHDLHRRADEPPGHRVAVGVARHQPVVGDDAAANQCCEEAGTAGHRNERCCLAAEALARHLVGRAVDAQVGDLGLPGRELLSSGRFPSFNMKTTDPTMFSAASDCDAGARRRSRVSVSEDHSQTALALCLSPGRSLQAVRAPSSK